TATPVAIPGSRVRPTFEIAGDGTNLLAIDLAGPPDEPSVREIFVLNGRRLLQLTDFGRWDTGFGGKLLDRRARRGYFTASADAHGESPSEHCQIFSVDTLGRRLRQLTHFRDRDRSLAGCGYNDPLFPG